MATPAPLEFPTPPTDPNDIQGMHRWMLSVCTWFKGMALNGAQMPFFSAAQLADMQSLNQLSQAGKIFFNNDTGKFNGAEVAAGALVIKQFTTT